MPKDNYTFSIPMDRGTLEAVRTSLGKAGFNLVGDRGEANYQGVTFEYEYNDTDRAGTLTLTITNKAFFVSVAMSDADIEEKVRGAVAEYINTGRQA